MNEINLKKFKAVLKGDNSVPHFMHVKMEISGIWFSHLKLPSQVVAEKT